MTPRAAKSEKAPKKAGTRSRKKTVAPDSRGLTAAEARSGGTPESIDDLSHRIERDGGVVLGAFRDPLGGHWQVLASVPLSLVEPTPYQRDLSQPHVERLAKAIDKLGRYLDPVITVRSPDGKYWTPNGHHRVAAMRKLGGRAITALVVPEVEVARRILLLNTEKAHNLRERAMEVARLAESIAAIDDRPERDYEAEFEEPVLLTIGFCYEERGRFAGGAFRPAIARLESFLDAPLPKALEVRRDRAARVLELEDAVNEAVAGLKERGLDSPYLKPFVVARIDPLRFKRGAKGEFDEIVAKMTRSAREFDLSKVKADQVARSGGAPPEE